MPLRLHLVGLSALVSILLCADARAATNIIPAIVNADTVWSETNLIQGTVTIESNTVVTIAPGTVMLMNTNAILMVNGQLLADGTTNRPIRFTRATTAARWSRMMFVRAADSRFRNCVIEYANSAGDHQDYYPTNCTTGLGLNPRPYHEAIVALASSLQFDGCLFTNLVGGAGGNEGDALAIIADDPQVTGPASVHVNNCRFDDIGQAIHTRFSYALVENSTFISKNGDNDDVDLYGESVPPPLIRNNRFLAGHEDKINPTRCSAIIINNLISGSDDHGVVLRDKCSPIVMNNVFTNCTAAAISVQNQCDALIANNTILNCGRGVRLFDHTGRHGPPYCLFPGNGRATVINTIVWNAPSGAFTMEQSTFQPYPFLNVTYCNVSNGISSVVSNGSNCTLVWGPGNFNADPQFTNGLRLRLTSPCIDTGTNALALVSSNWSASVSNDFDGVPRPLDGNGSGGASFDIGAFEVLLSNVDSNGDGIPDGWTWQYRLNPADTNVASSNPDGDAHTTWQEWVADTNPTNSASVFALTSMSNSTGVTVSFPTSSNRVYSLATASTLEGTPIWNDVPAQTNVVGTGATQSLTDTNTAAGQKFYRVNVRVP